MAAVEQPHIVGMPSVYVGYRPRPKPKKHRASSSFSSPGGWRSGEVAEKLVSRCSDESRVSCSASPVQERRASGEGKTAAGEQRTPAPTSRLAQQGSRRRQKPVYNSPPQFAAQNRRQRARQPARSYTPAKAGKVDTSPKIDQDSSKTTTVSSTSADSGRGEELSSSCESSVEPQVPAPAAAATIVNTLPRSRHSSCSDLDDDVFLDALSKLPSEDDDYSSIGSSAFVTPLSTRSQSPTHPHPSAQHSGRALCPVQLSDSLQRLQRVQDQQESSCDSHVTSAVASQPDHVTTLPLEPQAQLKEAQSDCPKSSGLYIGDMELSMEDHSNCCGVDFEFQTSTSSSQSLIKPALNRPDALCIPSSLLAHPHPHHQHSFSSISTASASPPSSTCSHSSPPLPLSPSPTPPCEGEGAQHEEGHHDITCERSESQPEATADHVGVGSCSSEREEGGLQPEDPPQDEWPDLCAESSSVQPSPLTEQFTAITKPPEAQPHDDGASNFVQWPLAFPHLLSQPQPVPPFTCPPPVLPSSAHPMVYCLQSAVYWPEYPSAFQPHPQIPDVRPHQPHPPDIRLPHVQPLDVQPPQLRPPDVQPQSPDIKPQSPDIQPQSPDVRSQSPDVRPQSPKPCVQPQSPDIKPQSPDVRPQSPDIKPQSPDVKPQSPDIKPQLPDIKPQSPDVQPQLPLAPASSCHQCFHPLHETWVMWYDKITGSTRNQFSDYKASLNHIYRVRYVEDFWRLYNNILLPSELDRNANYHFFKHNIQPLWEDPANRNGGKWVLTVREDTSVLDRAWSELLMSLIGEQMLRGHLVNGAVVSRRKKGDRIALWTSKRNKKANLEICKEFIRVLALACEVSELELPGFVQQLSEDRGGLTLVYMHHADSLRSGTSYQNDTRISLRDHVETILDGL